MMKGDEHMDTDYYNGYFSALNGYPFDESQSDEWKRGYRDGEKERDKR